MNCRIIEYYEQIDGKIPYKEWYFDLDKSVKARVDIRIKRLEAGNFGKYRNLNGGITELKFHDSLRVYFADVDGKIVLLLLGGNKTRQDNDIAEAQEYFEDYKIRNKKRC